MTKTSAAIAVSNVRNSSAWYQDLLGCTSPMDPSHDHRELFDLLVNDESDTCLSLSKWDHNPLNALRRKSGNVSGHGVVLVFAVADLDKIWEQAKVLKAKVIEPPHLSRGFEVPEFTILDPDEYTVTVSQQTN